ncbi:MAG: VCBS repeat-containing protein [Sciscionella sp.]|nr:VCBS repeat-containing protein [Sciscionella sp.]
MFKSPNRKLKFGLLGAGVAAAVTAAFVLPSVASPATHTDHHAAPAAAAPTFKLTPQGRKLFAEYHANKTTKHSTGTGRISPDATSGGHTGSFSGDGRQALLARNPSTGVLRLYQGTGKLQGTSTFGNPKDPSQGPVNIMGGVGPSVFPWIYQGDFNGDGYADVVGIGKNRQIDIALNQGNGVAGYKTLDNGTVVGTLDSSFDYAFIFDANGDGKADIIARKYGTGVWYALVGTGNIASGEAFEQPKPILLEQKLVNNKPVPVTDDAFAAMDDFTGDGVPDMIFERSNGELHLWDFYGGGTDDNGKPVGKDFLIGRGWNIFNAIDIGDVNSDGAPDLIARKSASGDLVVYPHTGQWNTDNPPATWSAPVVIGHGWNVYDIIS